MADPTNPYAQYANPYAVYGAPREPSPQTPAQSQQDQLQVQHLQQQIQQTPLQNENTLTNIKQGETSVASQRQQMQFAPATTAAALYDKFTSDPAVKAYREVIPQVAQAMASKPGGANDISVVYAWAKAMDPTGSVRDQDVKLGQSATSPLQQAQFMVSQYHLEQGGQLPPEVKLSLTEAMRDKARQLDRQYSEVRANFLKQAQASGIPTDIFGPHEGTLYRSTEEAYIRAHGGTPRDPNAPSVAPAQTVGDFGLKADPNAKELNPQQAAAYDAWWAANPSPTPERLRTFGESIGVHIGNAEQIIAEKKRTGSVSHQIDATQARATVSGQYSDKPDPRALAQFEQLKQGGTDAGTAAGVGITQGVTLNAADEIAATGAALKGSLSGSGSFGDLYGVNQQANQLYNDYLQKTHPLAYGIGELGGGAVLAPLTFGASTPAQFAGLSGAMGTVAGFNSGNGLENRLGNAALGGVAGTALGVAVPKSIELAGQARNALLRRPTEAPPLVDPATGELNTPMDAMPAGQRYQTMQDYGLQHISPGMAGGRSARVMEQGMTNLPASAGLMEDFNSAASGELRRSMQGVAQQFGKSKTLNEGGAAVQQAALERNDRAASVIGKAYDNIPIAETAPTSKANTVGLLQQLTGRFQSNPRLAEAMDDPKLSQYLKAFESGDISWKDMKDFRSLVGEKIGQMRFGEGSSTSDLRALYGALSQDMRDTASAQGPRALHAFERANNLNRQNEELIQGALTRILGKDGSMTPERAAAAIQAMTKGGKSGGDLKTLAQIRSATIKSGAWDEIASTLIHLGGQPANSEGRAFQPATFVNWYADMSEPARAMLFKPELRKSLDGFVAMTQQLSRIKGLNNTSNSAPVMFGGGTILTAAASLLNPILGLKLGGTLAANYGLGKLWTTPAVVRLLTGYGRAVASGNQNAVKSQIGRIGALAATNPELREPLIMLQQKLLSGANDNLTSGIAASQPADQNQNQTDR